MLHCRNIGHIIFSFNLYHRSLQIFIGFVSYSRLYCLISTYLYNFHVSFYLWFSYIKRKKPYYWCNLNLLKSVNTCFIACPGETHVLILEESVFDWVRYVWWIHLKYCVSQVYTLFIKYLSGFSTYKKWNIEGFYCIIILSFLQFYQYLLYEVSTMTLYNFSIFLVN